ncbi:MAG: hypothetical protein HUN04_15545 [Desulfobacter sp.]|nr:MAG: hypothetical protein HUN04_15545 [Desulfobacter sp.]
MTIHTMIDILFFLGTIMFSIGLVWTSAGRKTGAGMIFVAGMTCHGISLLMRYSTSFPLLPVYQGPFFIPFAAGLLGSLGKFRGLPRKNTVGNTGDEVPHNYHEHPSLILPRLLLVTVLSWTACIFPNDFYLPFLQFKTLFSPLFFFMGVAGKALFLLAALPAVMILAGRRAWACAGGAPIAISLL